MATIKGNEVLIAGMARTPIGSFQGGLSTLSAVELGLAAAKGALKRAKVDGADIDDVVAGVVYKEGLKGNPARQIQLGLNIPVATPACTVEQQCASGMRALDVAADRIALGKTNLALVCGIESMSNVPYMMLGARKGLRLGPATIEDALLYDALHDAFIGQHMGITAENIAERYNITRAEQDQLALISQQRAAVAQAEGWFKDEIVPVKVETRRGVVVVDEDEHPRQTTLDQLSKLKPVFKKDGTVTSGNASGINDGACAAVLVSPETADRKGLTPLIRILSIASVGCEPEVMGLGPVYAIPKAIADAGLSEADIEYYEINEAFAAQVAACLKLLNIPMDKVNACGSGIALGHPVGMTALRLVITAYYEMKRRGVKIGCASLCAGGGPAMAVVFERLK